VSVDARLRELGLEAPDQPQPAFAPRLRRAVSHGGLVYLSGNGDLTTLGRVGDDVTVEQAVEAARRTALLMCRTLVQELGSLDRVERWVKVLGLVRSAPGFADQPTVINGFTDQIVELWGEERGLCARSAIGVAELPGGLAVEVEATVAVA
jgi:enamine deaminase RidA (YjgF/YER057c/UK114 family)